jgi:glucose 1-dehydrogenase
MPARRRERTGYSDDMDNSLGGRIAIVTGSNSGIGQGTAIALAEAGADVVVTYLHDADGANDTRAAVEGAGRRVRVVHVDVRDEASVMAMFVAAIDAFGRVDILVNSAGVDASGTPVIDIELAAFDDSIRTNLYGPLLCCTHFLRHHRTTGGGRAGRIINITSVHEEIPRAGAADYGGRGDHGQQDRARHGAHAVQSGGARGSRRP